MGTPQVFRARVVEHLVLTNRIRHIQIELLEPTTMPFTPGQFLQLMIAPRVLRQYSMCSSPHNSTHIDLCVDISPGGEGSKFLSEATVGAELTFRGPFGVFVFSGSETRPVECIATGAGIAPFRSMIPFFLEKASSPLTLTFGNRMESDILYHAELKDLAAHNPLFTYIPTLSRPQGKWDGARGRVTELLEKREDLSGRVFYICGSPQMIDSVREVLQGKGIPEIDIHFEKFI